MERTKEQKTQKNKRVSLYPGKFRPLTEGHKAMIDTLLEQGDKVVLGIKREISDSELRNLKQLLDNIYGNGVIQVIELHWYDRIVHGRDTNYTYEYIDVPADVKKFSSSKVRKETGWK